MLGIRNWTASYVLLPYFPSGRLPSFLSGRQSHKGIIRFTLQRSCYTEPDISWLLGNVGPDIVIVSHKIEAAYGVDVVDESNLSDHD